MQNLFDFGSGSGSSDTDFFSKLNGVKKDYKNTLGEAAVAFANELSCEFKEFLDFKAKLQSLQKEYESTLIESSYIRKDTFDYDFFDISKEEARVNAKLSRTILNYIKDKWNLTINDTINPKYETEGAVNIDYANADDILNYLSLKTNNGNCANEAKNEMLMALYKSLPSWKIDEVKNIKNKIVIPSFYSVSQFLDSYRISHHCDKSNFYNALLTFIKEDFPGSDDWNTHIKTIQRIYSYSPSNYQGNNIFDTQEFTGNGITGTKLYKNGKFEIWFKTDSLASRFYKDYIMEAFKIGELNK